MLNDSSNFEKKYDHKFYEKDIYEFWESNGFFVASNNSDKETYTIVMPPPNITGNLHIGHALDQTIQDVIIRFKRMCGFEALLLPGTDHASIATEAKIIDDFKKKGILKKDLSREEFLESAWRWKEKYGNNIVNQIRKLGISCDWSRERFTMDDVCNKAVIEFFVKLYEEGLIYRGNKIVNWCPNCVTTLSDAEVEYETESNDFLYTLKYKLENSDEFLNISTTRPETIFGDTAVAVNPSDLKYKKYIGKKVVVPIVNRLVPVIFDDSVDPKYGTGVLKVTPAHSYEDFEISQRNSLEIITMLNEKGYSTDVCNEYKDLERFEMRKIICKDLDKKGLIKDKKNIKHNLGKCYRCGVVIEPMLSTQWFVNIKTLAEESIRAIKNENIKFIPKNFENVHFRWMENIKDWCISRQLWWGHRIPAWYCKNCSHITVSRFIPKVCEKCSSDNIIQDNDILDTWFSSALWPFSTLGWPDEDPDFKFFPITTLVTGYDIIFFWVSRMIFSSLKLTGKAPFKYVLIHGLVKDAHGKKMSKSLGNGIDPLELIEINGADVLRFSLIIGITPGNDTRYSKEKLEGSRNFLNKLWNASRFVNLYISEFDKEDLNYKEISKLSIDHNIWIISKLNETIENTIENFKKFEIGVVLQKIYSFFWDDFCDWYLEFSKFNFKSEIKEVYLETSKVCSYVLKNILKLFHPFIPFITEKIWKFFNYSDEKSSIMLSKFPNLIKISQEIIEKNNIDDLIEIIKSIRAWKNENKIVVSKIIDVCVFCDKEIEILLGKYKCEFYKFAKANFRIIYDVNEINKDNILNLIFTKKAKIYIVNFENKNNEELISKIKKEINEIKINLEKNIKIMENNAFIEKAPENVKNKINEKIKYLSSKLEEKIKSI